MTVQVCESCGQQHVTRLGGQACSGHATGGYSRPERRGKPCKQPPMKGQEVCGSHGGKAPQAKAAAEVRVAEAEVASKVVKLAATFGPVVGDPGDVIVEQIQWRRGLVAFLRSRVLAVDPDALVWGRTKEKIGGDDFGITREARPNAWLKLWMDASTELEKLCLAAISAGLEERRVRLAENAGDAWMVFIDGLLVALGVDPNEPKTAEIVERHLRAVGD